MVWLGLDSVRGQVVSEAGMGSWQSMSGGFWKADCPGAYGVWFMHACMEGVAGLAHASAPFQSFVFSLRCHLLYIEQALHLINEPIEIGKKLR